MKNGYFTMNDYVAVVQERFSDPNFVKKLMTGVTTKVGLIEAIEKYNSDNNLNEKERIKYSIGISGHLYITVIRCYKISDSTYVVVGRDNNGYGILNKSEDPNKSNEFDTTISTHVVDVVDISDVWISGYDPDKIGDILTDRSGSGDDKTIDTRELEKILTNLKNDMNSMLSTGELRLLLNKFTYVMKTNKLNEYTYKTKSTAYNLYTSVWTKYISVIKNILVNYTEIGINIDRLLTDRSYSQYYFVIADTDAKTKEIIKEKLLEKHGNDNFVNSHIDGVVEEIYNRTFSTTDIETFKKVITKTPVDGD